MNQNTDETTLKAKVIVQNAFLQVFSQYAPLEAFAHPALSRSLNRVIDELNGSGSADDAALAQEIRSQWNQIALQLAK